MRATRILLTFLGSVAAGIILTMGDAPAATDSPPVHIAPDLGTNGKNWTAPNGPGG